MYSASIIVFTKLPVEGNVKTRLAKESSDNFACRFYQWCAEIIFNEIEILRDINKYIFCSEESEKNDIKIWTGNKFFYSVQYGRDLGERMFNAFDYVFNKISDKAVVIGTDIPELNKVIIRNAIKDLEKNDMVIGPTFDGGYYLLGLNKNNKELFNNIEWSSNSVYSSTLKKAELLNMKVGVLNQLRDIDTLNDLICWKNESENRTIIEKFNRNFTQEIEKLF